MTQITLTESGAVRAYEPRAEVAQRQSSYGNVVTIWKCRGRVKLDKPGYRGSTTRQCNTRLEEDQTFCGKCGGLIAWAGSVWFRGVELKHLETSRP